MLFRSQESAEEIFARLQESADAHKISLGAAVYDPRRGRSAPRCCGELTTRRATIVLAVSVALDATYSLGNNLSGVGVYSRKLLWGLAAAHPRERFYFYYRPHRFLRSFRESLPANAHRRLLHWTPRGDVFHALNQRVDRQARRTVTTFHDLFVMTGQYSSPDFRAQIGRAHV